MAPIKPHRRTARDRVARSKSQLGKYAPPSPTEQPTFEDPTDLTNDLQEDDGDDDFGFGIGLKLNKKDKRIVKHNTLLNRVREGGIEKSGNSAGRKRRRPGKKLVTDITNLGDALPDVDDDSDGSWEGIDDEENTVVAVRKKRKSAAHVSGSTGKMEMKSLKHKPGAMKRKVAMEARERERFGRNLAGLMAGNAKSVEGQGAGAGDRWKALRGFIEGTLEKDRAFGGT